MRWLWLRAAMRGLDIGSTPAAPRPTGADEEARHIPAQTSGRAVRGPGFYVWDEDSREAESWARELRQSVRPAARPPS